MEHITNNITDTRHCHYITLLVALSLSVFCVTICWWLSVIHIRSCHNRFGDWPTEAFCNWQWILDFLHKINNQLSENKENYLRWNGKLKMSLLVGSCDSWLPSLHTSCICSTISTHIVKLSFIFTFNLPSACACLRLVRACRLEHLHEMLVINYKNTILWA